MTSIFSKPAPNQEEAKDQIRVESPGRVNLIGEHTDYNDGFVLPAAIQKKLVISMRRHPDLHTLRLVTDLDSQHVEIPLENWHHLSGGWLDYIKGVLAVAHEERLPLGSFDAYISGDLPAGSGLSSSSALTCGLFLGLDALFGWHMDREKMVYLASRAEYHSGTRGGLMDQTAILFSKANHALWLDCLEMSWEWVPVNHDGIRFFLLNSMVTHKNTDSGYNDRRATCEEALHHLKQHFPALNSIRDIDSGVWEKAKGFLSPLAQKRVGYVLAENQRVQEMVRALKEKDGRTSGQLLFQSHAGLRYEYEVSCPELDLLVDLAASQKGVLGARMVGGGFGGCTLNLVEAISGEGAIEQIADRYYQKTGILPQIIPIEFSDGATVFNI